ncbi:MAG: amidohydrolase family protein [Chthonomonadales bacterium]
MTRCVRARWIVPVAAPPIHNGEVLIENGRIADIRPAAPKQTVPNVLDLGNAIVLPGLVNAHTHLDYTVFRGLLEDLPFFPWIRALVQRKNLLTDEDWLASAVLGAAEAAAAGVTTIGDCTDSGAAVRAARIIGLKGVIYQEVFALDPNEPVEATLARLRQALHRLRPHTKSSRLRLGVSPHAPYTLHPEALKAVVRFARQERLPLCIHAAESQQEALLLLRDEGEFARILRERGTSWWQSPPGMSTIAYLDECGVLSSDTLLVHGVQVGHADFRRAARAGASWAHCPKSNAKLGNGVSPLLAFLSSLRSKDPLQGSVPIGLGSDSVASNNTMDLFEEMRCALLIHRATNRTADAPTAADLLYMATLGGASALGMAGDAGSLEVGKWADLAAISLDGLPLQPCYDPVTSLVHSASARDVLLTMVEGTVIYSRLHGRPSFPGCRLARYRQRFASTACRLASTRIEA